MAYRSNVEALEARLKDLESQVGDRTRERDEVAALLAEARAKDDAERHVAEAPRRRRKRRIIVLAALASLAVIAAAFAVFRTTCRNETDQFAEAIATLEKFTDDMCRCRDAACAQKVSDAMTTWSREMAKRHPKPPSRLTSQQEKDITAIADKLGRCMQTAMTPKPDPSAPAN